MIYVVLLVGNEMEQPFPLEGFQMLPLDTHSSCLILSVKSLDCSIWQRKLLKKKISEHFTEISQCLQEHLALSGDQLGMLLNCQK